MATGRLEAIRRIEEHCSAVDPNPVQALLDRTRPLHLRGEELKDTWNDQARAAFDDLAPQLGLAGYVDAKVAFRYFLSSIVEKLVAEPAEPSTPARLSSLFSGSPSVDTPSGGGARTPTESLSWLALPSRAERPEPPPVASSSRLGPAMPAVSPQTAGATRHEDGDARPLTHHSMNSLLDRAKRAIHGNGIQDGGHLHVAKNDVSPFLRAAETLQSTLEQGLRLDEDLKLDQDWPKGLSESHLRDLIKGLGQRMNPGNLRLDDMNRAQLAQHLRSHGGPVLRLDLDQFLLRLPPAMAGDVLNPKWNRTIRSGNGPTQAKERLLGRRFLSYAVSVMRAEPGRRIRRTNTSPAMNSTGRS